MTDHISLEQLEKKGHPLSNRRLEAKAESAIKDFAAECDTVRAKITAQRFIDEVMTYSPADSLAVLRRTEELTQLVALDPSIVTPEFSLANPAYNCDNVLEVNLHHRNGNGIANISLHTASKVAIGHDRNTWTLYMD